MSKANRVKKANEHNIEEAIDISDEFIPWLLKNGKLNLELAGIMFVNAHLQFKEGEKYFKKLELEKDKYNLAYKERAKKFDKTSESFYTFFVPRLRNIETLYEPTVRHFATCKILLVCCAETFINEVADVKLTGRSFSEFDKLSIVGKWVFIQDILKLKKKITLDKNPLQAFSSLVAERNKLIHFKGLKKDLNLLEIPDFLESLKLTPQDCKTNINAVKELIRSFCLQWNDSYGPDWLDADKENYRNPCFYTGNRQFPWLFYSTKHDKKDTNSKSSQDTANPMRPR